MALCLICSVFLLQLGSIEEDNLGDISRSLGAIYLALVAIPYQSRQKSAMVKMGMGQKNGIKGLRIERKRLPVSCLVFPLLIHAAVYKDTAILAL
jgi:hypothetical protein